MLLVLEGSITAEYGLDEEEKERQARELSDGSGAVTRRGKPIRKVPPRSRKDRVLGKGAPHDSMGWGVESVPIGRGYRGWIGVSGWIGIQFFATDQQRVWPCGGLCGVRK